MEPQIRYARTTDGVNIAYALVGQGPPLLLSPQGMICDILGQHRVPEIRRWFELLAQRYTVLLYDYRGFGSSQRDVHTISLETMLLDIDAVVNAADFERLAIFGAMINGAIACAYAHRFPHRVSRLILWSAGWGGPSTERMIAAEALDPIAEKDWNLYARLRMQAQWGWSTDQARAYTHMFRESTSPDIFLSTLNQWKQIEIQDILHEICAETLVVRSDSRAVPSPGGSERFAAAIPGARMVSAHAPEYVPWLSEAASIEAIGIIAEFLEGVRPELPVGQREAPAHGTAVILFTDIADSTALTERMGDAAFRAAARALDDRMRAAIREAGGAPVEGKVLGDGVMAIFTSAAQAIDAARRCVALSAESELQLHVGLHAGDVIRERDNVYGGAVNIASRICGLSAPGEILVSATIRDLARTSAGVTFEDRGEHALKGIDDGVRIFAVLT